ncbi:MAG TPA: 2-hydroxy-3-oxopropionate reductase [Acetobacteraceae bacterium]|nr:2-hydroxy-3-oxopropionate reductase [Acetobacteraceae bacterium]
MRLGFVGLGIMGRPMAARLAQGGHELFLASRSGVPEGMTGAHAKACATAAEAAGKAEAIFLMVPDTPDVEAALFGREGVAAGLAPGKTVIDMSSISPAATKDFAERINALGCDYLDAPVSGGEAGAKAGTLSIMVGGPEAAFKRIRPLLALMGEAITWVGGNGAGQTAKIANQIAVALTIEAVAEALVLAAKAGADPARVREALMGGFASSKILEAHGQRMVERRFEPGFRIELHRKDLALALRDARALGIALPNTARTQELFNAAVAHGGGGWDHSGLIRVIEMLGDCGS